MSFVISFLSICLTLSKLGCLKRTVLFPMSRIAGRAILEAFHKKILPSSVLESTCNIAFQGMANSIMFDRQRRDSIKCSVCTQQVILPYKCISDCERVSSTKVPSSSLKNSLRAVVQRFFEGFRTHARTGRALT